MFPFQTVLRNWIISLHTFSWNYLFSIQFHKTKTFVSIRFHEPRISLPSISTKLKYFDSYRSPKHTVQLSKTVVIFPYSSTKPEYLRLVHFPPVKHIYPIQSHKSRIFLTTFPMKLENIFLLFISHKSKISPSHLSTRQQFISSR